MGERLRLADAPDVLDVASFAAICGIGRNAAYAAIARGDIYSVKIGRSVRIPRLALEQFLLGPHAKNGFEAITPEAVIGGHCNGPRPQ